MNDPKPQNILDSPQWVSQSTSTAVPEADGSISPSGTGGPPPPPDCEDCHIDFYKQVVAVPWSLGGTYSAGSNVDLSKGGWSPDYWVPGTTPTGATVSVGGVVTFGNTGESIGLSSGVSKCPKCTGSYTLHIIRLKVLYEGNDVTNKITDVEVGNLIPLSAEIIPSLPPENNLYGWGLPGKLLKDYDTEALANPVVELLPEDRRKKDVSFHWVDGGAKPCTVNVVVEGLSLTAPTSFNVARPSARIIVSPNLPPGVSNGVPPTPKIWEMSCVVSFNVLSIQNAPGKTCWTQMCDYIKLSELQEDVPWKEWPKGSDNGLDSRFEFARGMDAQDAPNVGGPLNIPTWIQYDGDFTMFLMYQSSKPDSRWVPLRSIYWQMRMRASGPTGTPTADYHLDASSYLYTSPDDEDSVSPPDWARILQTAQP